MPPDAENVVVLHVRDGEIADAGSWIYAWLHGVRDGRVVYVGATGLPPEARAWLHLHDPDPDIGRIAARYPPATVEPLDILAIRLPEGVSRQDAKRALTVRLAEEGFLSESYVGDPPVDGARVAPDAAPQVDQLVALVHRHVSGRA